MREFFEKNIDSVRIVAFAVGMIAAVLVSTFAYQANAQERDSQFFTQVIDPVVQIDKDCSAVAFEQRDDTTYFVTALHCKNDKNGYVNAEVKDRQKVISQTNIVYDVLRVDPKQDLMTIKTRSRVNVSTVTIAHTDPLEGTKAWAVGYPLGRTRTITEGFTGQMESLDADLTPDDAFGNNRALLRATAPITGGNSGGALFVKNGENYELVGITDAGFRSFPEGAFFVPQDAIREIVDLTLKYEKPVEIKEDKRSQK